MKFQEFAIIFFSFLFSSSFVVDAVINCLLAASLLKNKHKLYRDVLNIYHMCIFK